jgi:hypothetical protein
MSESGPLCPVTLSLADSQACCDTLSTVHLVILSCLLVPIGVLTRIYQSPAFSLNLSLSVFLGMKYLL